MEVMLERFCLRQENNKLPRIILGDVALLIEELEGQGIESPDFSNKFFRAAERLKQAGGRFTKLGENDSPARERLVISIRRYLQDCGDFFENISAKKVEFEDLHSFRSRFESIVAE